MAMPLRTWLVVTILLCAMPTVTGRIISNHPAPISLCATVDDPTECHALIDFYKATDGDRWSKQWANNGGWLAGISYCYWFGVTCDENFKVKQL
jgi:hypothetical protein